MTGGKLFMDNNDQIVKANILGYSNRGQKGDKGDIGNTGSQGNTGLTGGQGIQGIQGINNYQIALNNGFVGTEVAWLLSLKAVIAARSISVPMLKFIPYEGIIGKNFFDKTLVISGHYINSTTGELTPNDGFNASAAMIIPTNTQITIKYGLQLAYFDVDDNYISGADGSGSNPWTFITPSNFAYMRLSSANAALETQQVELGALSTTYETACITFDGSMLKKDSISINSINGLDTYINSIIPQPYPWAINTINGLANFRIALSQVGERIINIPFLGDSITEGEGATSDYTLGYFAQLRANLQAIYGDTGVGFISTKYSHNNPQWSYVGTWGASGEFGVSGTAQIATGSSNTATLHFTGTAIDIVVISGTVTGTFTAQVDGTTPINFDTNDGTVSTKIYPITGLIEGSHTLVITAPTSNSIYLVGATPKRGSTGIRTHMCSLWGTIVGTASPVNAMEAEIAQFNPDLTVIAYTANNYDGQTSIETYKSQYQTLITKAKSYGDVLLLATGQRGNLLTIGQSVYVQALKDLAILNNCAMVSIFDLWGSYENAVAMSWMADEVHPSNAGHRNISDILFKVLQF